MSENSQNIPIVVKFAQYKTPKNLWFRSHLLAPLLIFGGIFTIYISVMVNRLAMIGFLVIVLIFLFRPGLEIHHMHHISFRERTLILLRELFLLCLILGGSSLVFLLFLITKSIIPGFAILFLLILLINYLENKRIVLQASRWNKSKPN